MIPLILRAVLVAGLLAGAAAPAAAEEAPAWLAGPDARSVRIHDSVFDTEAYVYEAGRSENPPVVLVHGLGSEGASVWRRLIPELAEAYHVVAMDLPGFGRSGKPNARYSPRRYAAFLDDVMARFTDGPVVLVGHSMGAAIALDYAHLHPDRVRRLILASTAGILHGAAYARFLSRIGVERFLPDVPGLGRAAGRLVQRVLSKFESLGVDPADALRTAQSRQLYLGADPMRIAGLALVSTDFSRIIRDTGVPTLLLWGTEDDVAPLRVGYLLTATLPHARLVTVEGGGHMFIFNRADRFNALVVHALGLSAAAFRAYAEDDYPQPESAPATDRTGECRGESGRAFSGDYRRLVIQDCNDVRIRNAHIGILQILDSDVSIRNSDVIASAHTAVVMANSRVEMTAVTVRGRVAVNATGSVVDAAGVHFVGTEAAVRAPAPSAFTFSVSRIDSPYGSGFFHDVYSVTADDPL